MKLLYFISLFVFLLSSCDFFSTRSPEPPDNNRVNFEPPTSAQIVIDNLIIALRTKNTENFAQCLSDSTIGQFKFIFTPSAEALNNYQNLFINWNKSDEIKVINSIFANLKEDSHPELTLSETGFDQLTPDSAVFVSSYQLTVPHTFENIPKEFSGSLQFTIAPDNSQLWSIIRWIDYSNYNDSLQVSWSMLKAYFSN